MANKKNTNKNTKHGNHEKMPNNNKVEESQDIKTNKPDSDEVDSMIDEAMEDVDVEGIKEDSKAGKNNDDNNDVNVDVLMAQAAEQLESAKAEIKEWKDNYTRVYAEWDTYRRRTEEQRVQDKITATESLVTEILPVLDDFDRSIDYAKTNGETGLLAGVEAVRVKLVDACCKSGMEVIEPKYGDAFDALVHQAVQTVEDKEVFDESIHSVLQKGFKMGNKVLRPATVVITSGGKSRPKDEDNDMTQDTETKTENEKENKTDSDESK